MNNTVKGLTKIAGVFLAITVIVPGLLAGCAANKANGSINPQTTSTQAPIASSNIEDGQDKIMEAYQKLLINNSGLIEIIKFVDKNISKVSEQNALVMIDQLEKLQKEYLPELEEKYYTDNGDIQNKFMEVFSKDFDIKKIESIEDLKVKELLTETKESGYKVETAEGMFFPVINYEFYKKYSGFVAADFKEYIDIMAIESDEMLAKDAALVVGWDELLKRAVKQEKFIAQYGNSIRIDDVKALYKKYLSFALLGFNNTPLFDGTPKVMVEDAKKSYMAAMKDGKEGGFLTILSDYMDLLNKNDYKLTDEVDKYRKDVLEKLK